MTKLLAFGFCPLPFENTEKNYGPGIRIWQFIQPNLSSEHEICIVTERIPHTYPVNMAEECITKKDNIVFYNLAPERYRDKAVIQRIYNDFLPDGVLCATIFSITPLFHLKTDVPIWIDLFGHVMAEAQAKAFRYKDNSFLSHYWNHEIKALSIGDIFSTVSSIQQAATIGELGLIGRLTHETTGYDFCRTIPCALEQGTYKHEKKVLRGISVPEDAFVVLWSGGYNTWVDIDTLIEGLELAMAQNSNIWFVSTGGQIDGHDEITYPSFLKKISQSPFKSRFLLKGWLPKNEVHNYYFEADLGINIDHYMYEGLLGSKNRVLDWMKAGLPALIGELCELSKELPKKGLAYSFPLNNPKALASILLKLSNNREEVRETGKRAFEYGQQHLNFAVTTRPFQEWLEKPWKSPDHNTKTKHHFFYYSELQNYIKKLEHEVSQKNNHIKQMEKYIYKLEGKPQSYLFHDISPSYPIPDTPLEIPEHPKISVIIVTWNGEEFIEQCLLSVQNENYGKIECIVIDNGSSDHTLSIVKTKFPNVVIKPLKKNLGFSKGVNIGIQSATGDVILLLNQDVIINKGLMHSLVKCLQSDSMIAIAGCKIYSPDGSIQHAGGILHKNGLTDHIGAGEHDKGQYDVIRDCDYVTGAVFAFKKQLVELIGYFDERFSPAYFEELDFCVRAKRKNYRVVFTYWGSAVHFESTSTGKFSKRFYYLYHRNRLLFIFKHHSLRYIILNFMVFEWKWLRTAFPKNQFSPLLRAYLRVSYRLPWLFIRDTISYIRKKIS